MRPQDIHDHMQLRVVSELIDLLSSIHIGCHLYVCICTHLFIAFRHFDCDCIPFPLCCILPLHLAHHDYWIFHHLTGHFLIICLAEVLHGMARMHCRGGIAFFFDRCIKTLDLARNVVVEWLCNAMCISIWM